MKVAVTGGSGVVGRALIRHLVAAGHEVTGLARTDRAAAEQKRLGAGVVAGDVLDPDSLDTLASGQEVMFHVAGVNELCSRHPEHMWEVNVTGSVNAADACQRRGVRRLVHTSSAVVIGEERGTVGTETSKHRGHFLSEYERSKAVSERLLLDRGGEVEIVAVNPSSVQGPGRSTGTGAIFLALARGAPFAVDTTLSLVDIDDCAAGHLLAAERGAPGNRYILSGPTLTVREAVGHIGAHLGRRRRPWFLRPEAVTALAPLVDSVAGRAGRRSPICPESARVLLHGHRYDGAKATRELGLAYRPGEETLARTIDWFRSEGLLA